MQDYVLTSHGSAMTGYVIRTLNELDLRFTMSANSQRTAIHFACDWWRLGEVCIEYGLKPVRRNGSEYCQKRAKMCFHTTNPLDRWHAVKLLDTLELDYTVEEAPYDARLNIFTLKCTAIDYDQVWHHVAWRLPLNCKGGEKL